MATKLGRMITYFDCILPKKSINDHIITCFCEITWQTKNISVTLRVPMATKLGYIQWGVSFHKVTRSFDLLVLQGHVNYFSCCITTTSRPRTTTHGKAVTYYKKLEVLNHTNLWTHGDVRSGDKLKHYISHTTIPLATKPGRVVTYNKELPSIKLRSFYHVV